MGGPFFFWSAPRRAAAALPVCCNSLIQQRQPTKDCRGCAGETHPARQAYGQSNMATNSTYDAFIQHEEDLRKWHADREAKGLAHGREEEQAYLEWLRSQSSQIVPVPQQRTQAATTKFNAAISRTGVLPAARPGAPTSTGARPRVQSPKEMKVTCQIVLNCAALSGYPMKRQMALLLGVC